MPLVPNYKRDLQAYGGVMDASGTQALTTTAALLTVWDADFGPTALNTTIAASKDTITVALGGIYEYCFETDWQAGAAHTVTFAVRDDAVNITGAVAAPASVTETASQAQHVTIHGIASIAAGSVLDVTVKSGSGTPTLTLVNSRFWVRRISPSS